MKRVIYLSFLMLYLCVTKIHAQQAETQSSTYLVPVCVYQGDTIPSLKLPTVYVYKPLVFKNKKEQQNYNRLIRDVKKTLPIAKEVNKMVIETYEYLQTLPNDKARDKHLKRVEKGVKEQYTPIMKKMTFSQGKLLIKLVNRETQSSSFELVKSFLGSFRASFYQTFASLFGASLKKEYDPNDDDILIERVVVLVESGQL
ncbi:MAG: DUF4294 domain-containing protein [Phocaeicola sp.]